MTQPPARGVRRITRLALLTAIALTIFMAEAQLPAPVPLPGVKLGLSNIVTLYAVFTLGPGDALLVLCARVFLGALFSGQMMTLFYAGAGGLLALAVTGLLRRFLSRKELWLVSPLAALCHNLGQLLAAAAILKSWSVFAYLPALALSGIITGLFTGLCARFLMDRLEKVLPS